VLNHFIQALQKSLLKPSLTTPVDGMIPNIRWEKWEVMMKKFVCLTICTLLWAGLVQAQGATTGSMSGVVVDPNQDPLPGVAVVATLPATGNRYGTVTDVDGRFRMVNLKVGGPYEVAASLAGFKNQTLGDVYVRLGETTSLGIELQLEAATGEIEVTGESSPLIAPTKMGVASSVSQASLEALPTIERSVYDMARTNPVFGIFYGDSEGAANELSVSGRNPRYNNISIDGAVNNDIFGLAHSGTPGGQTGTQPIQLDAVQELQLVTSSFDVRQGGFTGGSVNIITRSGTNNFHGGVFGYTSSDSWVGSGPDYFPEFGKYEDTEYGFSLGGPIAKDQLFFFVNWGHNDFDQPSGYSLDGTTGQCWRNCDFVDEAEALRQFMIDTYDYDPGPLGELNKPRPSDKIFLRFDYNLNQSHNLLLRYNYVDAANLINYPSSYTYEWDSEAYDQKNETNSFVGQWNAVFGGSSFNELRLTYQTIRDRRGPPGRDFPWIEIENIFGYGEWEFGSENYSTNNEVDNDIIEITDDFTFFAGNHEIVVGTHNEFYSIRNLFIQNGFGAYEFAGIDNFYAGIARRYQHNYPRDPNDPDDSFDTWQAGLYAGDTWRVKSNFTLVYGLRVDVPFFPDAPEYNPQADEIYGVRTDYIPDGNALWSPRIGFNWDIMGDGRSQLRGGAGLFSGRTPYVWISNNYARTGTRQGSVYATGAIPFNPDPYDQPTDIGGAATEELNAVDPNLDFPQTWRINLAYDHRLPWWDIVATAEVLYAKSTNEITYQNLNIQQTGEFLPFDGRPLYETVSRDYSGVYYMTNTDEGDALNAILKVELPYGQQPFWGVASYTYGEANVINDATSSRAVSNWSYNEAFDPNNPSLSTSDFEVAHRLMVNLNYEFNRDSRWSTTVSAFWNHQSGRPYMTILNGGYPYTSINGDGFTGNDLMYVPSGADDVVLTNGTWEQLEAYLQRTGADKYAGQILPRNATNAPWVTQTDLAIRQNIPIPGRSSLQVSLDIFNFWNLIDSDSGHINYVQYGTLQEITYAGVSDDGKPIYTLGNIITDPENNPLYTTDNIRSRWRLRLGVRWSF
jgi:hypothetical protein